MITFSNLRKAAWNERNSFELTSQVTLGKACNLPWPECQGHGEGEAEGTSRAHTGGGTDLQLGIPGHRNFFLIQDFFPVIEFSIL